MQYVDGEDLRQAWSREEGKVCLHPIYDREFLGTTSTGRALCFVCGAYLPDTYGRQNAAHVKVLDRFALLEWTSPGGQRYHLKLEYEKWWYRCANQDAWRPGFPPQFVADQIARLQRRPPQPRML